LGEKLNFRIQDIKEVYNLWKNVKRYSNLKGNTIINIELMSGNFCDKSGAIASIEYTHNHIKMVDNTSPEMEKDGVLWHTNHHKWLNPDITGSIKKGEDFHGDSSYAREERVASLLKENYGKINLEFLKSISRDHGTNGTINKHHVPNGLCRHIKKDKWITIFGYIVQPQEYLVNLTYGNPCKEEYNSFNFEDILKN